MTELILASASPRRADLLKSAHIDFVVQASAHEEKDPTGLSPVELAAHHAREKARDIAKDKSDVMVLGADTIVVCDDLVYGKPRTPSLAYAHLSDLSGRTHQVITAVCLIDAGGQEHETSASTNVTFRELDHEEIVAYCDTDEPMDKAGAYAAQGIGAFFIERFEGSFSNVVGLPMEPLFHLLKKAGLEPLVTPVEQ